MTDEINNISVCLQSYQVALTIPQSRASHVFMVLCLHLGLAGPLATNSHTCCKPTRVMMIQHVARSGPDILLHNSDSDVAMGICRTNA